MTTDKIVEIGARGAYSRMLNREGYGSDPGWAETTAKDAWRQAVSDALNTLRAAGYEVVPVEPTEAMVKAGCYCGVALCSSEEVAKAAYRAMIAAAKDTET